MTHEEFRKLPFLLREDQVMAVTEYAPRTLGKMIECGHLARVLPAGATMRRFRKVQVAQLAGLEWEREAEPFRQEPLLMRVKAVMAWTGYWDDTLDTIAKAGGLRVVRPAGMRVGKFRKVEVAALLGLERFV